MALARLALSSSQARIRPEIVGLLVLGMCAVGASISLFDLLNALSRRPLSNSGTELWREVAWTGLMGVLGVFAIGKSGLLALAARSPGVVAPSSPRAWLGFVAHFKLSLATLVAALVAGWWARSDVVEWLFPPPFVGARVLQLSGPLYWLVVCGTAWVPVVPFFANDVWRLLEPLMSRRAARLRLLFALASGLSALAAMLWIHEHQHQLCDWFLAR